MRYTHLTENERYMISALRKQGISTAKIAKQLGRHKATIYREIERNSRYNRHFKRYSYQAWRAQQMARNRLSRSRRNKRYSEIDFRLPEALLRLDWSSDQIVGYLRVRGYPTMSHELIYQHIWNDKTLGGTLWKHLRQSTKKRRKRYNSKDNRGRLAAKRHITERPAKAEHRKEPGHWEIDTVVGRGTKHCIVTLVDRMTGYTFIGQMDDRTSESLNVRMSKIMTRSDLPFKTITADNGTEFHGYAQLEQHHNCMFYFANPYHSWERGTNENTNGLIRQYLPKRTSMSHVTQKLCNEIAHKLNTRPRKRLGYRTPTEYIHAHL
ncbi:IS30 family transposase [Vibrio campbellii]|uniref:IS30-like element ISVa6 family transposase n=1 Tax=Vibrio campbellii TaxID=680 RepID=UPI000EFA4DF7|nr:IS30-like element ISVa6 family transposase [Vibrio campbellii]AYO09636.1 IS30 family transposase [Vibrio campbellii]